MSETNHCGVLARQPPVLDSLMVGRNGLARTLRPCIVPNISFFFQVAGGNNRQRLPPPDAFNNLPYIGLSPTI